MTVFDFLCLRCKKGRTKYISIPCKKCLNSKEYKKQQEEFDRRFRAGKQLVGRFEEVTAFGIDKKTGRFVGLGKRGKFVDPRETRYAQYPDDPHGWKATGKKVKTYKS